MISVIDLQCVSTLLELGEADMARKAAYRILRNADMSELWTIAQCANILDQHAPQVALAKFDVFAHSLSDEHRRQLAWFIMVHTGKRVRRTADQTSSQPTLSIFLDSRPGYTEADAIPSGIAGTPAPWEQQRNRRLAELARQLRDDVRQLPSEVRVSVSVVDIQTKAAVRRRRRSRTAQRKAFITDDYMRTRLGVDDRTASGPCTIFDLDDDNPGSTVALHVMAARIAEIRAEIEAKATAAGKAQITPPRAPRRRDTDAYEPDTDTPRTYDVDHTTAALNPITTTPCVTCWTERRPHDARTFAHATGYDDGLCGDCRTDGRTGLPPARTITRPTAATVAYLNPRDRQAALDAAKVTQPCAVVAEHLPEGAAVAWIRAYYRLAAPHHRPSIHQWITQWRAAQRPQPQPPMPTAPALAAAA